MHKDTKKYTCLSVFLYGPVVTELKVDHDTVIVLLVCEGSWRGSQNSEVVKTSFAVFSDILCTIGKKNLERSEGEFRHGALTPVQDLK